MPATPGQVMMYNGVGNTGGICVTWFFDPTLMTLRNNPAQWQGMWGSPWAANTAAFIGMNNSDRPAQLRVSNALGILLRSISLPANTNTPRTAASLLLGGLFLVAADFNGAFIELL